LFVADASASSAPNSPNPEAFTLSTVFLSLLPLLMVSGTICWIRRALRQREALLTSVADPTVQVFS
jgi:hypothetical protein|tara:strand:- start:162 stop:359 length:198 start_codon:yes stop_codon:yes gene_type:complete